MCFEYLFKKKKIAELEIALINCRNLNEINEKQIAGLIREKELLQAMLDEYDNQAIPPPQYLDTIDYNELHTLLYAEFPNAVIYLSDQVYKTTSKTELERFLKHDLTDQWQYLKEYLDCDDFSYALMGNLSNPEWGALPFGILWTSTPMGGHAVNCFIDKKRQVYVIEPQNDSMFICPDDWIPYLVIM